MNESGRGIGRRHLITGVAAAGAGVLGVSSVAEAEGTPPTGLGASGNDPAASPVPVRTEGLPRTESLPLITYHASTKAISALSMQTYGFDLALRATTVMVQTSGVDAIGVVGDAQRLVGHLGLPVGSNIARINFYGLQTVTGSQFYFLASSDVTTGVLTTISSGSTGSIAAGPWTADVSPGVYTSAGSDYLVIFEASSTKLVLGALVQYVPPQFGYVPVVPFRAYDSRLTGVPSPGLLSRNTSRYVVVANAIDGSGAVATPNVIPVAASAITYNLTATGTTGGNYLSVSNGLASSASGSAINWTGSGQTIANAATVGVADGAIKVFCGDQSGSTHFIVDVTGYYI